MENRCGEVLNKAPEGDNCVLYISIKTAQSKEYKIHIEMWLETVNEELHDILLMIEREPRRLTGGRGIVDERRETEGWGGEGQWGGEASTAVWPISSGAQQLQSIVL